MKQSDPLRSSVNILAGLADYIQCYIKKIIYAVQLSSMLHPSKQ